MPEVLVIRHAQASFGSDNYDKLSDLGHRQSKALGRALKLQGVRPARLFVGTQTRHLETLQGILNGLGISDIKPEIHEGLNEFDFKGLLAARYRNGGAPEGMNLDRKSHFRTLKMTVLAWSRDEIVDPPETWSNFTDRVENAMQSLGAIDTGPVLAVSSGGAIGQMVRLCLNAPKAEQIKLQLQVRNCSVTRFIGTNNDIHLTGFNETPHISASNIAEYLTYS